MADACYDLNGVRVFECDPIGPPIQSERDAVEIISEAAGKGVQYVIIPVERLTEAFFDLKTRIAGAILQKFVTYHFGVIVLGNIAEHVERSNSLRDFVYECNRGKQIWFANTKEELADRFLTSEARS